MTAKYEAWFHNGKTPERPLTVFERIIPFTERVRWQMLCAALDSGTSAGTIAKRLDWPLYRVNRMVMAREPCIHLEDVAQWVFAIDGAHLKFELVKRDDNLR